MASKKNGRNKPARPSVADSVPQNVSPDKVIAAFEHAARTIGQLSSNTINKIQDANIYAASKLSNARYKINSAVLSSSVKARTIVDARLASVNSAILHPLMQVATLLTPINDKLE